MMNDSLVVDQLILQGELPRILSVTQEWYDALTTKDPNTVYIILHAKDRRVYYGEVLIAEKEHKPQYLLSCNTKTNEYAICVNYRENYTDRLVTIAKYNTFQKALADLKKFNHVGSHAHWALQCYNIVYCYLTGENSMHDLLIGILCVFGYKDHPMLQALIEYSLSLGVNRDDPDISKLMRENLPHFKNRNMVFRLYSDLYDLLVVFNFFKDPKYRDFNKDIDISDFIKELPKIFLHTNSMKETPLE